jgi:catechol-2,3-dioxygenase
MDINHCHIQVPDMKKARAFYENYFQFSEKLVCEEHEVFLVNREKFVLGLEQVPNPEALPSWFHFGIGVTSEGELSNLFNKMKENGEPILRELKDFGDTLNFYCTDPTGNKIEVYHDRK